MIKPSDFKAVGDKLFSCEPNTLLTPKQLSWQPKKPFEVNICTKGTGNKYKKTTFDVTNAKQYLPILIDFQARKFNGVKQNEQYVFQTEDINALCDAMNKDIYGNEIILN